MPELQLPSQSQGIIAPWLAANCTAWWVVMEAYCVNNLSNIVTWYNTHTHPFNSPLSGTTQMIRHQKGKANLDFTKAREWAAVASPHLTPDRQPRQHATAQFLKAGRPSYCPINSVKAHTHTHTHTRLMALCSGLPGWAGTRKVKPNWILLKQETVSGSGIRWAICKSAPHSRQITTPVPHRSVFLQTGCPSRRPTNSVKALKANVTWYKTVKNWTCNHLS